jgi:hypothetical protein
VPDSAQDTPPVLPCTGGVFASGADDVIRHFPYGNQYYFGSMSFILSFVGPFVCRCERFVDGGVVGRA